MNKQVFDYLVKRVDGRRGRDRRDMRDMRDYEDGRRGRDGRDGRDMRDYEDGRRGRRGRDRRDMRDYEDGRDYRDYEDDHRGRGSVDFEGSMDFDERDYAHAPRLSKTDMHRWKQMMENEDGTHGPHYDMQQVMDVADKLGINFERDEFTEKEFCVAVNMMYSDYCKVAKKYVSPDREIMFFAELANAFLCDEDGPGPSEKLALYFNCIVDV